MMRESLPPTRPSRPGRDRSPAAGSPAARPDSLGRVTDVVAGLVRGRDDLDSLARGVANQERRLRWLLVLGVVNLVLTVFVLGLLVGARLP